MAEAITIEAAGREVRLSNPDKPFFSSTDPVICKRDLAEYYLEVADAALIHLRDRPTTLKRFVDGAGGDFFFQKRIPKGRRTGSSRRPFTSRADDRPVSSAPTMPLTCSGP